MKTAVSLLLLLSSTLAWSGERASVQQVKGKKAIVRFENEIPFGVGQNVLISSSDGGEIGVLSGSRNLMERRNSIAFGATISSLKAKSDGSESVNVKATSINLRYGWNKNKYEYGLIGGVEVAELGSSKTNSVEAGGYFEYNLVLNNPGEDLIYGPYGEVTMGSEKDASDEKYSPLEITVGGFAKWFFLSPVLAFRGDVSYQYEKANKRTMQGFVLSAGLNHYF